MKKKISESRQWVCAEAAVSAVWWEYEAYNAALPYNTRDYVHINWEQTDAYSTQHEGKIESWAEKITSNIYEPFPQSITIKTTNY